MNTRFKSNVASAKYDLDPRSSLFQLSARLQGGVSGSHCSSPFLPCIALFFVLVYSFLGVHSGLGKKEEGKERGKEGERKGGMGWDGRER